MDKKQLTTRFGIQQALHWFVTGITIPILTLMFQVKGLDLFDIGIVMAIWIGTTACLEVPLGGVADAYGRKRTYFASLVVSVVGVSLLLIADNIWLISLAAFFLGSGRAIYSGTLDAWFYDAYQSAQGKDQYHGHLAQVQVFVTLGLAAGSLTGGYLPQISNLFIASSNNPFSVNLVVVIALTILLFGITAMLLNMGSNNQPKEELESAANVLTLSLKTLKHCFQTPVIFRVIQGTVVLGMALSVVENHWQPFLRIVMDSENTTYILFGVISALYFLMEALASLASVRVAKWLRGSHLSVLFYSRMAAGIALVFLAQSQNTLMFALGYLGFFFLFTLGCNSENILLNENTESSMRSSMLSVSSLAVTLGGMATSLGFGLLSHRYGIQVSFICCGILLIVTSFVYVLKLNHQPQTVT
ncbi:major facilitator superfamily transporter [Vibrio nigripulchritudo ATCC 27043]|uniref:MFS transporter n=1 Tax=Vibrio nigripulchritudo TaxID=28173 RepID=UPI00021C1914|nr:MFS transporter [Vibrio nigripulchritudo]EGU50885.1 major facilitator superfamily transporter [Vibrio nigripulchritudo ATCC 27043]